LKKTNLSIFIPHVGCRHRCAFCDQRAIAGTSDDVTGDSVRQIISEKLPNLIQHSYQCEIAFFGGSFTAIPRQHMLQLLTAANEYLTLYPDTFTGIRCSTRPDSIDDDVLLLLKHHGVTAIELGAQSTDEAVLAKSERGHTAADIRQAAALIKKHGFELGLQLMTGLPLDTPSKSLQTARDFVSLHPDTARIYPTLVMPNTKLAQMYASGEYQPFDLGTTIQLCAEIYSIFTESNIRTIRIGLNQAEKLKRDIIAGPWDDTLGERVIARYYLNKLLLHKEKRLRVCYPRRLTSKILGVRGENRDELTRLGFDVTFEEDNSLSDIEISV
jgi:histone acetyltransferase (RNA polymerase elongator complex component)